jgi:DNA-binding PadR family transcriptional regulator
MPPPASKFPEDISMVDRVADRRPLAPAVFHILLVLADSDQHGYAIIRAISKSTDGRVRIGPGTLYRSIQHMLEEGLLVEADERPALDDDDERRRYYRITPLGRKVARAEAERLAALVRLARASGFAPGKA